MYTLSVPIQNRSLSKENRQKYLDILRRAEADRVFLICGDPTLIDSLTDNVAFFKKNGLEVGVWIGSTVGHGVILANGGDSENVEFPYPPLVNLEGQRIPNTRCPLDEGFIRDTAERLCKLADCGASVLLLDDDFRLSQHGDTFCCACPRHLARMSAYCGEEVTLKLLREKAFCGKQNKYRDAWFRAEGDSMREFAEAMRSALDRVHPETKLAFCTAHSPWDIDGCDVSELTRIFAGKHPPLLRLHGAPYWAALNGRTLPEVIEIARMFASFCRDEGFELMAEGDVYPRPRYNTPASYLELFDAAMRADGNHNGILKYMVDYTAGPDFESGYLAHHARDLPHLRTIESFFSGGANEGVRVLIRPHLLKTADLDLSSPSMKSPYPDAGILLAHHGIPTVYSGNGYGTAAFGENVHDLSGEQLSGGVILDGVGAAILTEMGIDVGILSFSGFSKASFGYISTESSSEIGAALRSSCRMLSAELRPTVSPVLFGSHAGKNEVLAYTYQNADGQRFLVYLYDGGSTEKRSGLTINAMQGLMLRRVLPWLCKRPLPVLAGNHPDLTILVRRDADSLSLLLLNSFPDAILTPNVDITGNYRSLHCSGCKADLHDGRIIFHSDIPAFGFASVRLSK